MPADPEVTKAVSTFGWTFLKYAAPMIIVAGIVSGIIIYIRTKAEKKIDTFIQKRKDKPQR